MKYGASFLKDSLDNNDSYRFFRRLGDLIITGPTRTNVMDLHILLVGRKAAGGKREEISGHLAVSGYPLR
jgi:hypothetical protein